MRTVYIVTAVAMMICATGNAQEKQVAAAVKSEAKPTKAAAEKKDLSNDPKAVDLLRQIEQRYGQMNSVSGRFRQTKVSPEETGEPDIQSFASFNMVKPNKFRADYEPPRKSTNLINGDYSYQYVESIKQLNRYKFQGKMTPRDLNYLLLGFGAKTEDLLKVYSVKWLTKGVTEGYYGFQLIPLEQSSANFKFITILVTSDGTYRPAQFSMQQLDGVRITVDLDLTKLEIGGRIKDSIFQPNFPVEATDIE